VHGRAPAIESPIGWIPRYQDIEWSGLESLTPKKFDEAMAIHPNEWRTETESHEEFFKKLKGHLPEEMEMRRRLLLEKFNQGRALEAL
jgi:phosphoenolpyruvate carboxykinase (GTP)